MSLSGVRSSTPQSRTRRPCESLSRSTPRETVRSRAGEENPLTGELPPVAEDVGADGAHEMFAAGRVVEVDGDAPRLHRRGRRNVDSVGAKQSCGAEGSAVEEDLDGREARRAGHPAVDVGA